MSREQTIPVLDLKDFTSGSSQTQKKFVEDLGRALNDIGFFALENHGINPGLIDRAYGVCQKFFELSANTKQKYEDLTIKGQRGFTSFGREHAKDNPNPDLKEFWHVGRELKQGRTYPEPYPANLWPSEVSEFKPTMLELYEQLEACALSLLDACSLYIDEDRYFLRESATDGNSILRVIHYPPIPETANAASIRAAAHEDINLITLLCESTADGLELLQRDGQWRPIRSLRGQIIVDSGDMIQNLTNGLIKSTTHRVVNPDNSKDRRFSMPFFVHPKSSFDLSPRQNSIRRTGGKKLYPDITAGQYLDQRLNEIGLKAKK